VGLATLSANLKLALQGAVLTAMGLPLPPDAAMVTVVDSPVLAQLRLGVASTALSASFASMQYAIAADCSMTNATNVLLEVVAGASPSPSSGGVGRRQRLLLQNLQPAGGSLIPVGAAPPPPPSTGPSSILSVTLVGFGANTYAAGSSAFALRAKMVTRDTSSALFRPGGPLATITASLASGPDRALRLAVRVLLADTNLIDPALVALQPGKFELALASTLINSGIVVSSVRVLSPPQATLVASGGGSTTRSPVVFVGVGLAACALGLTSMFVVWAVWSRRSFVRRAARNLWAAQEQANAERELTLMRRQPPPPPPVPYAVFSVGCDVPSVAFATRDVCPGAWSASAAAPPPPDPPQDMPLLRRNAPARYNTDDMAPEIDMAV
jgi:hypothetical protein